MEIHHLVATRERPAMTSGSDKQPWTSVSAAASLQQRRDARGRQIARRDPRAPLETAMFAARSLPETCGFHTLEDIRGCRKPRSCRDCLQQEGCMVSNFTCMSTATYAAASDYTKVAFNSNGYGVHNVSLDTSNYSNYFQTNSSVLFPAKNATYCTASDPACISCRHDGSSGLYEDDIVGLVNSYHRWNSFFMGADGCICISGCEDPLAFTHVAEVQDCKFADTRLRSRSFVILASSMLGVGFLIAWMFLWSKDKRASRANPVSNVPNTHHSSTVRGLRRYMLDTAPALHLDLYGWRHFQNEILRKEQELLSGAGDVSPVARPLAFEFAAIPTAPDFDEEEESTAPTITNPHALASAPVFRLRPPTCAGIGGDSNDRDDPSVPSAPEFE